MHGRGSNVFLYEDVIDVFNITKNKEIKTHSLVNTQYQKLNEYNNGGHEGHGNFYH